MWDLQARLAGYAIIYLVCLGVIVDEAYSKSGYLFTVDEVRMAAETISGTDQDVIKDSKVSMKNTKTAYGR